MRGRPPVKYSAQFCSRYDTPIAEIITDILGALLRGLYATFSIATPKTTVRTITSTIAAHMADRPLLRIS